MLKLTPVLILLTLSTTGCASTAIFDRRACPTIVEYSKHQQVQLADELKAAGPTLKGAFVDYGKLRDKVRACRLG